jgi:hypothetical protein
MEIDSPVSVDFFPLITLQAKVAIICLFIYLFICLFTVIYDAVVNADSVASSDLVMMNNC